MPQHRNDLDLLDRTNNEPKIERPKKYKVILHNDDFTPFELVVMILQKVFKVGTDTAVNIMMTAHTKNLCVITVLPKEVAETKVVEAMDIAKGYEAPLMLSAEPEE